MLVATTVPNITGSLHMGHAVNLVLQDVLVRFRRARGFNVYFPVGTDYAGLSGQYAAERRLADEGRSRHEMGDAAFQRYMDEWQRRQTAHLTGQMKRLGLAANWRDVRCTNDAKGARLAREMFVRAFRQGLAYEAMGLVNWCARCGSCIGDPEVARREMTCVLVKIRPDDCDGHALLTLNPELLLGCVALGITKGHPSYDRLLGRNVTLPLVDRSVPIVDVSERQTAQTHRDADKFDRAISLVVPSYSVTDLELALERRWPVLAVYAEDGRISETVARYAGMEVGPCRDRILRELEAEGRVLGTEEYLHGEAVHSVCGSAVRPRAMRQWYLRRDPLERAARAALDRGVPTFPVEDWSGRLGAFVDQMFGAETLERKRWWEGACLAVVQGFSSNRDWIIARQNAWGVRLPAWDCADCGRVVVDLNDPGPCPSCSGRLVPQRHLIDPWFGSAFWPLSVDPWPARPVAADLVVVGHDILYMWVQAATMLASALTERRAIGRAVVHGLVCDDRGVKLSKSLGNAVDLDDALDRYGAEVMRAAVLRLVRDHEKEEWLRFAPEDFGTAESLVLAMWSALSGPRVRADASALEELPQLKTSTQDALERDRPAEAYAHLEDFIRWLAGAGRGIRPADANELLSLAEPFHPFLVAHVRCSAQQAEMSAAVEQTGLSAAEAS